MLRLERDHCCICRLTHIVLEFPVKMEQCTGNILTQLWVVCKLPGSLCLFMLMYLAPHIHKWACNCFEQINLDTVQFQTKTLQIIFPVQIPLFIKSHSTHII